jgi:putative transposase
MATANPSWGYTRIQGALRNVGHRVARSTIARILKAQGIPPSGERPIAWRTFLRAHWPALVAADFFTTEVWTVRGLVTYYTVFVIELHSRRVHIVGSTPHPDEAFVVEAMRHLTDHVDGVLRQHRVLICDRDSKWSPAVLQFLETAGVRVIQTPFRAPNCNAHAERFVRSIRDECLNRVIPLGERHFRRTLTEYVTHYHEERNHQGIGNELMIQPERQRLNGPVRRRERMGGLLNYYYRAAWRLSESGWLNYRTIRSPARTDFH